LAAQVGKQEARRTVEAACREAVRNHQHLRDVMLVTPEILRRLPAETIHQLFEATQYLGASGGMIDKVLATARSQHNKQHERSD
jgi:3-carboxy-cis,cis-muconate cycloisomerase